MHYAGKLVIDPQLACLPTTHLQLLKTLSFACEEMTFADACTAAQQLIEEFSAIPTAYTRAIGSPMVSLQNDILVEQIY